MLGDESVNDFIQCLTLQDLRQLIKRQIDAMIRYAALRIIIGACALGSIRRGDLAAASGASGGVLFLARGLVEARAQLAHRLGAIAVLGTVLLQHDADSRGDVSKSH